LAPQLAVPALTAPAGLVSESPGHLRASVGAMRRRGTGLGGLRGCPRPGGVPGRPVNPQFPFPRFPIWPDSESGNRESPIPDLAGNGNRGPDWPQIGKSGMPVCVSTACTILPVQWAGCCLESLKCRFRAPPPHTSYLPKLSRTGRWRMATRTRRWRTMGRTFRTMSSRIVDSDPNFQVDAKARPGPHWATGRFHFRY
jgi:hypothetical protein